MLSRIKKQGLRNRRLRFERLDERLNLSGDFQTSVVHLDVNDDGQVSPIDALGVINFLNANGSQSLDPVTQSGYNDTSGDGVIAPIDVLLVFNHLNEKESGPVQIAGEGESSQAPYFTGITTLDVDGNRRVDIQDALSVVRYLRQNGAGVFDALRTDDWVDADGSGYVTIMDVITIIRDLRANGPHDVTDLPLTDLPILGYDMVLFVAEGLSISFVPAFIDPEQGPYSIGLSDIPNHGTLSVVDATWTYTPNGYDDDAFTFTAEDTAGNVASLDVVVHIVIGLGPHAPTAMQDIVSVVRNTQRTFNVLTNDKDVDGDVFSIVSHTLPAQGTLEDLGNGSFTYTPNVSVTGTDSFTYTIEDSTGLQSTAAVGLNIRLNNVPQALSPVISTTEDTPSPTFVLAQLGTDADGDSLQVTFGTPGEGIVEPFQNGYRYIPNVNFTGTDSVSYRIWDGFGEVVGLLTFIVEEPRFTGPMVNRGDLVFAVVEFNGGVLYNHTAQHYQDIGPSHPDYAFIEEAYTEGWIQGGYAAGSRFYVERSVTYGELAYLLDQAFGLPGEDFVSSALAVCAITPDQANRLADNPTRHEVFRAFAAVDHGGSCDLTESELESLARDVATFLGTTY